MKKLPKPAELHLIDGMTNLKQMKTQQPAVYRWRAWFGVIVLIFCAIAGYFLFRDAQLIIGWFKDFGIWGSLLFAVMLSIAIVILLPTPFIKIGAGAIFPFWIATAVNFVASMVGGLCAFLLGRWLFRDSIKQAIENDERMKNIEKALDQEAMKISVLVRLSPILPDEWLNYIMSATPVSTRVFLISNTSSLIYSLIYAYYGHALGYIALSNSGISGLKESPMGVGMLLLGVVATIVVTIVVTRTSIRALREAIGEEE